MHRRFPFSFSFPLLLILFFCLSVKSVAASDPEPPGGVIRGQVRTSDGKPAAFVSVILKNSTKSVVSGENGEFVLRNVPEGEHEVEVSLTGYSGTTKAVIVTDKKVSNLTIQLSLSEKQLESVVVTASRRSWKSGSSDYASKMPLKNMDNPQVYTTITKDLLRDQMIFSVDDATRNVPGLQQMWAPTGRGGDGGSFYNARGFILQSSLRNGIAGVVTNGIDAINLEKMEVLKGPSATLFGSSLSSYGGLINRVTKQPFDHFGGEVSYSAGSYNFNRVSADVNAPIDKKKHVMFRLNTAYQHQTGFQPNMLNNSLAVAPSLLITPNERLTIHLDAELFSGKNIGSQAYFFYFPAAQLGTTTATEMTGDYNNSYIGSDLSQTSRSTNLFGQVNYTLSKKFTSSTNITSSNSFSNGFSPYFYYLPNSIITGNDADTGPSNYIVRADQSTRDSRAHILEVQQLFNGEFQIGKMKNKAVFGLDFLLINNKQNFFGSIFDTVPLNVKGYDYGRFNGQNMTALYSNGAPDFTYPIINKKYTYSAFFSDVLSITDRLSVLAAIRADRFDNKGGLQGGPVDGFSQTAFSPKFGVVFQPVKDKISLFANYQNSFNNLGYFMAYDVTAADSIRSIAAKPEQANQFEAGVKVSALNGKISGSLSYYDIRVNNILRGDTDPAAAIRFAQRQDGTQVSKGVELELNANPVSGLNIIAGTAYNDSKLVKSDEDVNGRRPATASSPFTTNLWISYQLPFSVLRGLGLGFGGNHASENKILNSVSQGVFTLPAFTILNATAFYDFRKFRVSAKVDNLTNRRYWIGYTTMNPQRLRNVAASISYKF